jgi:hypothetical protein
MASEGVKDEHFELFVLTIGSKLFHLFLINAANDVEQTQEHRA